MKKTADEFAKDYEMLWNMAESQECKIREEIRKKTIQTTEEYREFKSVGTEKIAGCKIRSLILPLLADHVLREANHYLRILKAGTDR